MKARALLNPISAIFHLIASGLSPLGEYGIAIPVLQLHK